MLAGAPRLRWIQVPYAGISPALCAAARERGIIVTNSSGIYSQTIAEHALGLMLALSRRLEFFIRSQHERRWRTPIRPMPIDLCGKTVAIVGVGRIGQAIARLCRAFGMEVFGSRRTLRATPFVDRVFGPGDTAAMAAQTDWLICALPLTKETERMLDAAVFAALPAGSRFINVSRGAVVDEPALVAALTSGRLMGAGLDVTAVEPLATDSPLWAMDNVIITDHTAGTPANASDAAGTLFLRNLHRFLAALPLENQVNLELGY
jgi:phosphoglycerate dehydrogenase-like enzyme